MADLATRALASRVVKILIKQRPADDVGSGFTFAAFQLLLRWDVPNRTKNWFFPHSQALTNWFYTRVKMINNLLHQWREIFFTALFLFQNYSRE